MAMMQGKTTVVANTSSVNVVAGLLHEFVPNGARITMAACGSAAGLTTQLILNIPVLQDVNVNLQNRYPIIPDDIMYQGVVRACRVFLKFTNTTGGNLDAFWRVDIN